MVLNTLLNEIKGIDIQFEDPRVRAILYQGAIEKIDESLESEHSLSNSENTEGAETVYTCLSGIRFGIRAI